MDQAKMLITKIISWLTTQYSNPKTLGNYTQACNSVLRTLLWNIGHDADAPLTQEQLDTALKYTNSTFPSLRCYYALFIFTAYLEAQGCSSDRFHLLCKTKTIWADKAKAERQEQPKKDLPLTL